MKPKHLLPFLATGIACCSLHSIEAQDLLPVYFESLSNGKKDTLWIGYSADAPTGCSYDSTLCNPVFYPFPDTAFHVGAFAVTGDPQIFDYDYSALSWEEERNPPLECPVFLKKRVVPLGHDIPVVLPAAAAPVRVSWDSALFAMPAIQMPLITDYILSRRWDMIDREGCSYKFWMTDRSSFIVDEMDSARAQILEGSALSTNVEDSAGNPHRYLAFFVCLGYDEYSGNEMSENRAKATVRVFPNPVLSRLSWQSPFRLEWWRISDVSGKVLLQGGNEQVVIEAGAWKPGLYLFDYAGENGEKGCIKFLKN